MWYVGLQLYSCSNTEYLADGPGREARSLIRKAQNQRLPFDGVQLWWQQPLWGL